MQTKILLPTQHNMELAAKAILENKIVCYPTDTIYGIAANPFSQQAVSKIFQAKQRPDNKPIILLASKNYPLENLVYINKQTKEIIKKYWPASLTIIFKLKEHTLASQITCGSDTIAIRVPDNNLCNSLCELAGGLITSTSANLSGKEVKTTAQDILAEFGSSAFAYILDGGTTQNTTPSTIIDATGENIKVLRMGKVMIEL